MQYQSNKSLSHLNTFGIDASAKYYVEIQHQKDLTALVQDKLFQKSKLLILGGGSNILLTDDFDGLVIKNCIKGINPIREDDQYIWLQVGAGELWHDFVLDCIENDRGGVENLSLIPGTVGAAPMQNIGAYGVEIKDTFESLEALHLESGAMHTFDNITCDFGYRDSVFKNSAKNKYIITSVTFRLTKHEHVLNTSYGAIKDMLSQQDITFPGIKDISEAVIKIRQSKLPDPTKIGNAGSFFKNPTIDKIDYEALQAEFPTMPAYQLADQQFKIPAGWLIEQCGWKGKTIGNIGVHKDQALVLVNYGKGKGIEISKLAAAIQQSVIDKYGIALSSEVNFIPGKD
jgi:UDP-N-acetylmuramate dehydrogenase